MKNGMWQRRIPLFIVRPCVYRRKCAKNRIHIPMVMSPLQRLFSHWSGCKLKDASDPPREQGTIWSISHPYGDSRFPYSLHTIHAPQTSVRTSSCPSLATNLPLFHIARIVLSGKFPREQGCPSPNLTAFRALATILAFAFWAFKASAIIKDPGMLRCIVVVLTVNCQESELQSARRHRPIGERWQT